MAVLAAGAASARDIVISDSSSPLSAGAGATPAGGMFANTTTPNPASPAVTQSGSCLSPNISIKNSAGGVTAATDVRDAIQKAVNPAVLGVQAGDNVYLCEIAQSGTGAPAANTYAPAEAGDTGTAIDLSATPELTIAAFPGQTPILEANSGNGNYRFFTDSSTQGRQFTLRDLVLTQGPISSVSGGFIQISNAVTPGELLIQDVTADEFDVQGGANGGVVAAENVDVIDSTFGANQGSVDNYAAGDGGAIFAEGDVLVRSSGFGLQAGTADSVNQAGSDGGAIFAGGNVTVEDSDFEGNQALSGNGGAIAAVGEVEVTGVPSSFIGNGVGDNASGDGGGIYAQSVLVENASLFGATSGTNGIGLQVGGNGGAIATYNITSGCGDALPTTPCVPGVVEITGAATFGDNQADGNGGAIHAAGGVSIDGQSSGVSFTSTSGFVNQAAGGGAIAVGGLFNGANTAPSPRACVASSSLTNLDFTGQTGGTAGGGALHVLASATDSVDPTKRCSIEVSGGEFDSNNAASGPGGAVFIKGGNVNLADNLFNSNTTTTAGDGGAVATGGDATNATRFPVTTITGSEFTDNQSAAAGGAIANGVTALNTVQTTISDTLISGNEAPGGGGGISSTGPGSVNINQSEFSDNTAGTTGSGGAALIAGSGNATFDTSDFLRNEAGTDSGNGGALSVTTSGATRTITGNSFVSNTANGTGGASGGAIYTQVSLGTTPGTLTDNLFAQNAASAAGGAILHQAAGNLTSEENVFRANYATAAGGALGSTSGTLTVEESQFEFNATLGDGGALFGSGTRTVLDDSVFLENKAGVDSKDAFVTAGNASDGGAARITSATYRILDSVFAENLAADDGGAVDATSNGSAAGDGTVSSEFLENRAGRANAAQASTGGALNLSGPFSQNVDDSEFLLNGVAQTNTDGAAVTRGGAIAATGGNLNLSRSTVAGNAASSAASVAPGAVAAAGGGVYMASGHTVTSTNSTLTGNSAPVAAVGWASDANAELRFNYSTIAGNQAPANTPILVASRTAGTGITIQGSILAEGPTNGSACVNGTGGAVSRGNGGNVLTDTTDCGGTVLVGGGGAPATKVTAAQLDLKPLADNGGPTDTMAIGLDSVAAASSTAATIPDTDQRGLERPDAPVSSGAYQLVVEELTVSKTGSGRGTVTSIPAGIDCGPDCNSETAEFAQQPPALTVTLTATPEASSAFISWGGPCIPTGPNSCEVTLDEARFVTANFQDASRTLTVSRGGNGEGTVTSAPAGIDCGTKCVAGFEDDSTVTLTAAALGNSTFDGWSGACAVAGKSPTCTLTMDASKTVTATFTQTARVGIQWNGDSFRVPKSRKVKVGRVDCVNGSCEVVQATARVKVRGKTYRAKVQVNRDTFTTGEKRVVKVVVPKAAYKRLRKGRNTGRLYLVIRAEASLPGSFIEVNRSLGASLKR